MAGTLEEINKMQKQGIPDSQIISSLQQRGYSYKDISEALSQSKIRSAVEDQNQSISQNSREQAAQQAQYSNAAYQQPNPQGAMPLTPEPSSSNSTMVQETPSAPGPQGMQKSMLPPPNQEGETTNEYMPTPQPQQYPDYENYSGYDGGYAAGGYDQYQNYDYAGGISSETITEISEQVVSEKMMEMRKHLGKVIDFKTTVEAKVESLEERLKRIEKIIDTLQTSVLRKVGDYTTNVDDIKKELIETQKSFTKLLPELKETAKKHKTTHRKKKTTKKKSHK